MTAHWESEWGRPVDVRLYREEREAIWDALFDVRRAKQNELDSLMAKPNAESVYWVELRHLRDEIAMLDDTRRKMQILY